ncbi:MAG: transglutaminaseTgpA domain-containing protein [Bifidobacteriaceae bacterium]|jgi:hypothetical protein|nr:transglutaminaseTgpA domain-containing protein [Bifidobacteriaceae bacterium]
MHSWSRPTLKGVAFLLASAALIVVGAGFQYIILVVSGLGLTCAVVCEGVAAAVTHLVFRRRRKIQQEQKTDDDTFSELRRGFLRFVVPGSFSAIQLWDQLDQNDTVIRSFSGSLPHDRGIFRNRGMMIRWNGVWGLWKNAAALRSDTTVTHAARTQEEARLGPYGTQSRRPKALGSHEDDLALSLRPYSPGDPERQISWKMSARRGHMMTRVADHHQQPHLLIVLDTLLPTEIATLSPADWERLVSYAHGLTAFPQPGDSSAMFTDGYAFAETPRDIEHFLAAVTPSAAGSPTSRAEHIDVLLSEPNTHALFITFDSEEQGSFEACLEDLGILRHTDIVRITPDSSEPADRSSALPTLTGGGDIGHWKNGDAQSETTQIQRHRRAKKAHSWNRPWSRHVTEPSRASIITTRLLGTTAMEFVLITSLVLLSSLFASHVWLPYAIAATAIMTAEIGLIDSRRVHDSDLEQRDRHIARKRTFLRAVCMGAALLLAGVITATITLHSTLGVWWFHPRTPWTFGSLFSQLTTQGSNALLYQSFPVSASVYVDISMIAAVTVSLVILRILFTFMRLRIVAVAAPFAVMTAQNVYFGTEQPTWLVFVCVFFSLIVIWFSQKLPVLWPQPVVLGAAAAALALALAPFTNATVDRLNLPIGSQKGLFSSSAVNPLIDLSRNLRGNSASIALDYNTSNTSPVYIRMATLDSFNGDTWTFGSDADPSSSSASAAQSKPTATSKSIASKAPGGYTTQTEFTDYSPLMQYTEQEDETDMPQYRPGSLTTSSKIWIETLTSRFMPLVGLPTTVTPSSADWRWSKDATAYSSSTHVKQGDTYSSTATYVEPMASRSDLSSTLDRLEQLLYPSGTDMLSLSDYDAAYGGYEDYDASSGSDRQRQRVPSITIDTTLADASNTYVRKNYVAIPKKLPKSVTKVITEARQSGISTSSEKTRIQQTAALAYLLDFFQDNDFTYSLDAPDGNGTSNMEMIGDFLVRKSGYCVHYATSFAVLARALGIPTRVVMGYLPSATTDGGNYVVTNQELHAWAEAYITGIGWVPFDVTPSSSSDDATASSSSSSTDSADSSSDTKDSSDSSSKDSSQSSDTSDSSNNANATTNTASDSGLSVQTRSVLMVSGGVLLAILLALVPLCMRRLRRRKRLTQRTYAAAWDEILDTARDCGIAIPASATEQSIVKIIADAIENGTAGAPSDADDAAHRNIRFLEETATHVEAQRFGNSSRNSTVATPDSHADSFSEPVRHIRSAIIDAQKISAEPRTAATLSRRFINLIRRMRRAVFPASVIRKN